MKKENQCEQYSFQLKLLMNVEEMKKYPFTKMVIEKGMTEQEYNETLGLLELLDDTYKEELEYGLIDHSSLLLHYAGMLCSKLPVEGSLQALEGEGLYPELAKKLLQLKDI
ncbi:DUF1878 family protein [Halobacillus litoralis]|uniref:DUF1878 domain-containing protein n=1 Tax=Halobacillus litoralis TaxID=45668 RepID=A0A410MAF0_9BACI|nr:DUF1878 family protein [Halobacillus litoralis]QAS51701.1 hypothetical protein HLI_05380 [Halobacillus litoralis]